MENPYRKPIDRHHSVGYNPHMTNAVEKLELLKEKALKDSALLKDILASKSSAEPLDELCQISRDNGIELYPMEIIADGEDFYAAKKRSTNGGGENSPTIAAEDDIYELFMLSLEGMPNTKP